MNFFSQKVKNLPDINDVNLAHYLQKVQLARTELIYEIKNNKIAPLNISYKTDDLEEFNNLAKNIKSNFKISFQTELIMVF